MPCSYCNSVDDLLQLLPHVEIAHHVPGRIRLKIHPSALNVVRDIDVEKVLLDIPGVRSLRINAFAKSVVIEYNCDRLPHDLWTNLGHLKQKPELAREIAALLQDCAEK